MSKTRTITPNPPADFMPEHQNIRPFRAWCQKVLPLVYDDSLSYYELLCKVLDTLNKTVIEVINLGDAYDKLEDYVNHYFDNLDVQEEINNKIDQMVEDGTLAQIVGKYYVMHFDTTEDMISYENLFSGVVCFTQGYYSSGDGGGGHYNISSEPVEPCVELDNGLYANLITETPVNILKLGCKKNSDCTEIINKYTEMFDLFVPKGVFLLSSTINLKNDIIGESESKYYSTGSVLQFSKDFDSLTAIITIDSNSGENKTLNIRNITLDCNNKNNSQGVQYSPTYRLPLNMSYVAVINAGTNGRGVSLQPVISLSSVVVIDNCEFLATSYLSDAGITIANNAHDSSISNTRICYFRYGIVNRGGTLRLNNLHLYAGNYEARSNLSNLETYFSNCVGINSYAPIFANQIYIDSFYQFIVQRQNTSVFNGLMLLADNSMVGASSKQGTVLRCEGDGKMIVSNLGYYMQDESYYNVLIGANVFVDRIVKESAGIGSRMYLNPFMVTTENNNHYKITTSNSYSEICRFYINNNFSCSVIISDLSFINKIDIVYDGTVHIKKTNLGTSVYSLYYKVENGLLKLYASGGRELTITLVGSNAQTFLVDYSCYRTITYDSQSDDTGLTVITENYN